MNMIIQRLSELTALYSPLDFAYNQAMSGPYVDYRDKTDDGETVAGLKDGRISGAWRPMVCTGSDKWQKSEIKRLWDISHDIYYLDFLIDGQLSEVSRFLLMKGYRARPVYSQVIDLTKTQKELHADLRKSYKSLVNKIENVIIPRFYAPTSIIEAVKKIYQGNRGPETWDIQARMLCKCEAYCVFAPDTYALIYCNDTMAYYASGRGKGDSHAVLWCAILEAKRRDIKCFELGEQYFSIGMTPDEKIDMQGKPVTCKQVDISFLKRGFGGRTITRLILEK